MKIAMITGATSGIGEALARILVNDQYKLILTGRRLERLQALQQELQAQGAEVCILHFDVRDYEATRVALESLPQEWRAIDVLVNNAGLAVGLNPVQSGVLEDWERMLDTNVKGLLYVTRIVSPWMVDRKAGHIVNICSIAGKEVYPNGNVYCASKHAVDALTKGMRQDLLPYGIRVSQICPGAVETEFSEVRFKGDKERAAGVYKGFDPLTGHDVAEAIRFMIQAPAHVCINDMVIMPTAQANSGLFHKNL